MEIRNMRTFLQVCEAGSFTKAAEAMGYTQAAVSFQINQLEEEFSCKLFDRIGHNIYLTPKGELFRRHALSILHSVEDMTEEFRMEEKIAGHVRICTSDSICEKMMLDNYMEFYHTYPNISLSFYTGSTRDLLDILNRNEADIIFTLDNHIYQQNCIIAKEAPVNLYFVANADSPLSGRKNIPLAEILQYPLLLTERGMSYQKILDNYLSQKSLEMNPILETGRTDILLKLVLDGVGITFLPEFVAKQSVDEGKLVFLDIQDFQLSIWKQLIYRRERWMSRTFRAFLEFVINHEFTW